MGYDTVVLAVDETGTSSSLVGARAQLSVAISLSQRRGDNGTIHATIQLANEVRAAHAMDARLVKLLWSCVSVTRFASLPARTVRGSDDPTRCPLPITAYLSGGAIVVTEVAVTPPPRDGGEWVLETIVHADGGRVTARGRSDPWQGKM